jgi:hypothetical protein
MFYDFVVDDPIPGFPRANNIRQSDLAQFNAMTIDQLVKLLKNVSIVPIVHAPLSFRFYLLIFLRETFAEGQAFR